MTTTTFTSLGLSAKLNDTLSSLGYQQPTPIQAQTIPFLLDGDDVLAQAQTGTGKTAAFTLPMLSNIDPDRMETQALIVAPTRELAIQVAESCKRYASAMRKVSVLPIYGGESYRTQLQGLKRGAHVVVGTPGRLMDHLKRKTLSLNNLNMLILDEADEMLNMGFLPDIEFILSHTPENTQKALFSATLPKPIKKIARTYLLEPKEVLIKSKTNTVSSITQQYLAVNSGQKLDALLRMLEYLSFDAVIIFTKTKTSSSDIAVSLQKHGYLAAALNGDITQENRKKVIDNVRKKTLDIIVATDVAARGIDLRRIDLVVNYDLPFDTEPYIHRIGRTGRAGREGKAISFVSARDRRLLQFIEKATKTTVEKIALPSVAELNQKRLVDLAREVQSVKQARSAQDELNKLAQQCEMEVSEIAPALLHLLQKIKYPAVLETKKPGVKKSGARKPKSSKKRRKPNKKRALSKH